MEAVYKAMSACKLPLYYILMTKEPDGRLHSPSVIDQVALKIRDGGFSAADMRQLAKRLIELAGDAEAASPRNEEGPQGVPDFESAGVIKHDTGLPENFTYVFSARISDKARGLLARGYSSRDSLSNAIRLTIEEARSFNFPGLKDFSIPTSVTMSSVEDREAAFLKMNPKERVAFMNKLYPSGLPLLDARGSYLKWRETLVGNDAFYALNHSQSLMRMLERGGLSTGEAVGVMYGLTGDAFRKIVASDYIDWMRKNNMLM